MEPFLLLAQTTEAAVGLLHGLTTAAYFGLAMLCVWAWRGERGPGGRLGSTFWPGLAAMFAALTAAKLTSLQWRLAEVLRRWAVEGDWYDDRRRLQARVIMAVLGTIAITIVIAAAGMAIRRRSSRTLAAFAAVAALLGFLAVRAVSLHHVDRLLYRRVGGMEVNGIVELSLLGLVAAGLAWLASDRDPGRLSCRSRRSSGRRGPS